MNADTKKEMVASMVALDDWPPAEIAPGACGVTGGDLQKLVSHCHSLFKFLFTAPHTLRHQNAADIHAKLLLSAITRLDRIIHSGTTMPNIYEVKYNFISLPRAVRLLSRFGSARNIQEGGVDGEGVVKMLRPLTPRGLKQHFARNLLDSFHRDLTLEQLCEEVQNAVSNADATNDAAGSTLRQLVDNDESNLDESETEAVDDVDQCRVTEQFAGLNVEDDEPTATSFVMDSQQFKKYKTITILQELRKVGLPLSFIVTTGFPYFHLEITTDQDLWLLLYDTPLEKPTQLYHSVLNYGHLLPHLASLAIENRVEPIPYAVITTDAYHMDANYDFV
jgi:hypothetical protein